MSKSNITLHRDYIKSMHPKIAYDAYFNKKTPVQLSEMYGISITTVYNAMSNYPPEEVKDIFKNRLKCIYISSDSHDYACKILFQFGVSFETPDLHNEYQENFESLVFESSMNE